MILLRNGQKLDYMTASGALGFGGKGWFWEWPLIAAGLIDPSLFFIGLRTITMETRFYRVCNHSWWLPWTWFPGSPWACWRTIPNGTINKISLYNPGFEWWCNWVGPGLQHTGLKYIASMSGTPQECGIMAKGFDRYALSGIEVNGSCPNTEHKMSKSEATILAVLEARKNTKLPLIVKVSVDQDYEDIARALCGIADAISLNSVPFATAFPGQKSPLEKIGKPGTGGGGVSGKAAQEKNWEAVKKLAKQGALPVIAPSVMEYEDMDHVRSLGAKAISFGAIHLPTHGRPWTIFTNPCKPTKFVKREKMERKQSAQRELEIGLAEVRR